MNGRNYRSTTKVESLAEAKDIAEDWYLEKRGKARSGELPSGGKSFKQAADVFLKEVDALLADERAPGYLYEHDWRLRVHLLPFFKGKALSEITPGLVQEYRIHRMTSRRHPTTDVALKPSRSSLHKEIVTLRQVLKCANRHGWLPYLPDLSAPFRGSGKISHRAWFSNEEYVRLYTESGARAKKPLKARWRWASEQLHDKILLAANSGLRPDELGQLEFRDVKIVTDDDTGKEILLIEVRGKRGVGYCKTMPGAVLPFRRLSQRKANAARIKAHQGQQQEKLKNYSQFAGNLVIGCSPHTRYKTLSAGVAESVDATDLSQIECLQGNPRCRTAQTRGTL